jgi:hypothetical protein
LLELGPVSYYGVYVLIIPYFVILLDIRFVHLLKTNIWFRFVAICDEICPKGSNMHEACLIVEVISVQVGSACQCESVISFETIILLWL